MLVASTSIKISHFGRSLPSGTEACRSRQNIGFIIEETKELAFWVSMKRYVYERARTSSDSCCFPTRESAVDAMCDALSPASFS